MEGRFDADRTEQRVRKKRSECAGERKIERKPLKWEEFGLRCKNDEENCNTSKKKMETDSFLEKSGGVKLEICT
jgi:hypothetical protein